MNQIKRFVGAVKTLEYYRHNLELIFNIDKYGHDSTGIDIFPHEKSDGENLAVKRLKTKLFSLYILEMFIAEASGKKNLFLDHRYYLSMQPRLITKKSMLHSHTCTTTIIVYLDQLWVMEQAVIWILWPIY